MRTIGYKTQMNTDNENKVVLITGAAKRIGAAIARHLHQHKFNIALHYLNSKDAATALCTELNQQRPHSAVTLQADLLDTQQFPSLIKQILQYWNRLDILINNASTFYPTPFNQSTEQDWQNLMGSNLKAPYFLSQAAAPHLAVNQGCIINMADIYAETALIDYSIYCMAKAGLVMQTKLLAKILGPDIRVNGIAPGTIFWPENQEIFDNETLPQFLQCTSLKRVGTPEEIAHTVQFLIEQPYITGQIIKIDGGRSLY